jgi:Lrp/AsnC family transcriptional regulator for asnA, asnC and gidA
MKSVICEVTVMDELDKKLVLTLQRDGRQSFTDLGKMFGVTEGTVRKRIKSLVKGNVLKIVGVPNVRELGYNFISIVGIQVQMEELDKVQSKLSKNPSVCQLSWVTGRYDLIAVVATQSSEEFANFMANELSTIPSVVRTETFVSLGMFKGTPCLADTMDLIDSRGVSLKKQPRKSRG